MKFGPAPHDVDADALKGESVIVRRRAGVIQSAYYDYDLEGMRCWVHLETGTRGWYQLSEIELV